jgi:hypothetical protein
MKKKNTIRLKTSTTTSLGENPEAMGRIETNLAEGLKNVIADLSYAPPGEKPILTIETPDGPVWFPTRWQDITLSQFIQIQKAPSVDQVLAILSSNPDVTSKLSLSSIRSIKALLPFIQTAPPLDMPAPATIELLGMGIHLPEDVATGVTFAHLLAHEQAMEETPGDGLDWMLPAVCILFYPILKKTPADLFDNLLSLAKPGHLPNWWARTSDLVKSAVGNLPYQVAYPLAARFMEALSDPDALENAGSGIRVRYYDPSAPVPKKTFRQQVSGLFRRKQVSRFPGTILIDSLTKQPLAA